MFGYQQAAVLDVEDGRLHRGQRVVLVAFHEAGADAARPVQEAPLVGARELQLVVGDQRADVHPRQRGDAHEVLEAAARLQVEPGYGLDGLDEGVVPDASSRRHHPCLPRRSVLLQAQDRHRGLPAVRRSHGEADAAVDAAQQQRGWTRRPCVRLRRLRGGARAWATGKAALPRHDRQQALRLGFTSSRQCLPCARRFSDAAVRRLA